MIFEEFAKGMLILSKGNDMEKMQLSFRLLGVGIDETVSRQRKRFGVEKMKGNRTEKERKTEE